MELGPRLRAMWPVACGDESVDSVTRQADATLRPATRGPRNHEILGRGSGMARVESRLVNLAFFIRARSKCKAVHVACAQAGYPMSYMHIAQAGKITSRLDYT